MNNWIEIDKEIPAITTVVIITDGVNVSCGWLIEEKGELEWRYMGSNYADHPNELHGDVTHWMPLPETPKRNG